MPIYAAEMICGTLLNRFPVNYKNTEYYRVGPKSYKNIFFEEAEDKEGEPKTKNGKRGVR